jgi:glycosyltransferase involved in cell wall biosynthesis
LKGQARPDELDRRLAAEVDLARVADSIVSVSSREAREFRRRGVEPVHVLGHAYDVETSEAGFEDRSDLLFVGAIHQTDSPNGDSILWFVNEIMPLIQESRPGTILDVVGVVNSEEVRRLASDCVRIHGPADDLRALYESARVFVAPTRFSAGVPLKVTEASAHGVPVVATALLAGQLEWEAGRELLVADTAEQFARHCLRLLTDPGEWERVRQNALNRVRDEYAPERFDRTLLARG